MLAVDIGQKLSIVGIVSGTAAWGALLITVGIIAMPAIWIPPLDIIGACLYYGSPVVALVGLGVGIAGMVKSNPRQLSTIAGVALPASALVGAVLYFIVSVYALLTFLSNQP